MKAPAESSRPGVFVSHLSIKECGQAWGALVSWWGIDRSHNLSGEAGGLIPFAVTLHELSETAHSVERRSADAVAATDVSVAETGAADLPRFRYRCRVPWNARTDGRLKSFLLDYLDLIDQPDLAIVGGHDAGFRLHGLPGPRRVGFAGLLRAYETVAPLPRKAGQQMHALVYLDAKKLANAWECGKGNDLKRFGSDGATRAKRLRRLANLEHAIEVSIRRIDRLDRFRGDRTWRDTGLSENALRQIQTLQTICRPRAASAAESDEPCARYFEPNGLACVTGVCVAGRPTDVKIVYFQRFLGGIDYARQRLSSALHFSLEKTGMNPKWSKRRTAAIQSGWIERALAETGDCEKERRFLGRALNAARQSEAAAKSSGCNTVVAIVRMDEALLALKAPDATGSEGPVDKGLTALAGTMLGREVTTELSAVLDARARPCDGEGRVARKADRMAPKADRGEDDVWLAPQEGAVWRKSRPGATGKRRQFQGAQRPQNAGKRLQQVAQDEGYRGS